MLELLIREVKSLRDIRKHASSISRKIKRDSINNEHTCDYAEEKSKNNKSRCGRKLKLTPEQKLEIEEKLKLTYSPEQVSNTLSKRRISFKTIYEWIYKGYLDIELNTLRRT